MFVVEIYRIYKRSGDLTSYLVIIYMVLGIFGQLIHGFESVENSSFRPKICGHKKGRTWRSFVL